MPLSFQRIPGPGETRDCTDPWKFLILRANGDVCLCCRSPAVGNLRDSSLESIVDGEPARELRAELLSGELAEHCHSCCERGVTSKDALRRQVEELLAEDDLDVIEQLRAENGKLMQARAELFRERDALRGHATNLEGERPHLLGHIANLEAEIARLKAHVHELESRRSQG
jgi:hypothetical protein